MTEDKDDNKQYFTPGLIKPGDDRILPGEGVAAAAVAAVTPDAGAAGPSIGEKLDVGEAKRAQPTENEDELKTPKFICSKCSRDMAADMAKILPTIEDKRGWMRHILGEPRFRHTYDLMNGHIRLTLRTRTTAETDAIFKQLNADIASGIITDVGTLMNSQYLLRMMRLMLLFCAERVEISQPGAPGKLSTFEEFDMSKVSRMSELSDEFSKNFNEAVYAMLIGCQRHFEGLVSELLMRCDDPNFFLAAAGDN